MTNEEFLAKAERVGGFAFPASAMTPDGGEYHSAGMTLRDWFAGQAMAAMIGRPITDYPDGDTPTFSELANDAYSYADAMLEARK